MEGFELNMRVLSALLCFCGGMLLSVSVCVLGCVCAWDGVCPSPGCPTLVGAICPGSLLRCFNILHLVPSPAVTCRRRHSAVSFTHQVFPHFLLWLYFKKKSFFFPFLLASFKSCHISINTTAFSSSVLSLFSPLLHLLSRMHVGCFQGRMWKKQPAMLDGFRKSCEPQKMLWSVIGSRLFCGRQREATGRRKSLVWYGYKPDSGRLELLALMCWLLLRFSGCVHTTGLSAQLLPARPSRKPDTTDSKRDCQKEIICSSLRQHLQLSPHKSRVIMTMFNLHESTGAYVPSVKVFINKNMMSLSGKKRDKTASFTASIWNREDSCVTLSDSWFKSQISKCLVN